ncbi:uncharacterized protein [Elaeis guineensis]|uniref:Uncharacterized protein LOC105038130 isoform X3 n=1 Tax=Elaeis guineensis var. tenera TaxID=51953 RepID=A0A6J0PEG9_ELAGV|nr:uncharacterized protein LOC105038130 isoform X3 [Elaeis guineensis]XP_019704153.1 uncharacterized protein LOC105038130 isoform X3 [Elaeis guineensis]
MEVTDMMVFSAIANEADKGKGTNSTLRHQVMDLLRILEKRTNWQYLGAPLSGTFYGRMLMEFVIQDKSNSSTRQGFQAHPFMLMKRKCYRHAWGAMNKFGMIVINGNMIFNCLIDSSVQRLSSSQIGFTI